MRVCKKVLFIICISFGILFFGGVKNIFSADFDDFVNEIAINDFDISIANYNNHLIWTRSLTDSDFASSGTIRGASGDDISVLSGGAAYQGFHLFDLSFVPKEIHFVGNIEFSKFNNAIYSLFSETSFDADKINFSSNTNTAVSLRRSTISFNTGSVNFINNAGSAINIQSSSASFNNQITNFTNNIADRGGAIFALSSTMSFYNSTVNFIGNQANGNDGGGALYISNSIIDFQTSQELNFVNNTALGAVGGGAIYFSNSRYSKLALLNPSFINNYAVGRGGAILIQGDGSQITIAQIIAQDRNVVFSGNKANGKPNDIHFIGNAEIDFNAAAGRKIELNGGITAMSGNNTIEKLGDGALYFNAGSSISFNGDFNVRAGSVIFATNAYINTINISADASLGASIDFVGNLSSILYLSNIIVGANVNLSVKTIKHASVAGTSAAFIYTRSSSLPSNFASVIDVDGYTYTFSWNLESDGFYKGYLTYGVLFNWNDFIDRYQQTTINNKLLTLGEDIKATASYNNAFGTPIDNDFTIEGQGYTIDADNFDDLGIIVNNSSLTFKDINFRNFKANSDGAVMNIAGNSSIVIKAQNHNIAFLNNTANGENNDIYITDADIAMLEFGASNGRKIEIGGGIKGGAQSFIKKTGSGDLIFLPSAIIDFGGEFNIESGNVITKSNIDGRTIKISTLIVSNLAGYSMQNSVKDNTQIENSANIGGTLYIDASDSWADTITADNIILNRTSKLFVHNVGLTEQKSIVIMIANIGRDRGDFLGGISDDNNGKYSFHWSLENGDYKGYLTFEGYIPSPVPGETVAQKTILANSLSLSARTINVDEIYNRLNIRIDETNSFWFSLSGGANTFDKFDSILFGLTAGADFYNSQDYVGGIFVRHNTNSVEEEGNKGEIKDTEIGLYGGSLGLFGEKVNFKVNISMGFQNYDMQMKDKLEFSGQTIKGGFEFERLSILNPFIGFQAGYVSNEDAQNAEMVLYKDSFIRAETRLGLGLKSSSKGKKFHWRARLYAIVPITGAYAQYKIKDADGESEIKSNKESSIQPAFSFGGEYEINHFISITAQIRADYNKGFGYLYNIGTALKF
ncbi:MAG: autotransporter domain-containing protein [Elusimicrobiota bacterium]|jgi:predicted outer membrane repeat protein|nr:autotransporter domain-containing protein [Elusimicrobiota bacterium]